jgi:hypothetical protein
MIGLKVLGRADTFKVHTFLILSNYLLFKEVANIYLVSAGEGDPCCPAVCNLPFSDNSRRNSAIFSVDICSGQRRRLVAWTLAEFIAKAQSNKAERDQHSSWKRAEF